MYLGLDFLITPDLWTVLIEANIGLPGGAQEFDLTHLVHEGRPSGIFERIEALSRGTYGHPFGEYLHALSFIRPLKALKLWMDEQGPFPDEFHPALRLEDKWLQYGRLGAHVPMPRTMPFSPGNLGEALGFLSEHGKAVLKRRTGRGGYGFKVVDTVADLERVPPEATPPLLLQEHIESRVEGMALSVRAVAFAGHFLCMYANLAEREHSNHGTLAFIVPGEHFGLEDRARETVAFDLRSWEASIWFGPDASADPAYLRHNLNEERVLMAALVLPRRVQEFIRGSAVMVERLYEALDPGTLPPAWFESPEARL
jgi:hypothetical protein